jgi:hypothetical protein
MILKCCVAVWRTVLIPDAKLPCCENPAAVTRSSETAMKYHAFPTASYDVIHDDISILEVTQRQVTENLSAQSTIVGKLC